MEDVFKGIGRHREVLLKRGTIGQYFICGRLNRRYLSDIGIAHRRRSECGVQNVGAQNVGAQNVGAHWHLTAQLPGASRRGYIGY